MNINEIQKHVECELTTNMASRKSDNELILGVLKRVGIDTSVPFSEMIRNPNRPNFKSITRARRKIQAECPWLRDDETAVRRAEREEQFREFAKR